MFSVKKGRWPTTLVAAFSVALLRRVPHSQRLLPNPAKRATGTRNTSRRLARSARGYEPQSQMIFVAHTGVDAQVYAAHRSRNAGSNWSGWTSLGGVSVGTPAIAATTSSGPTALATRAPTPASGSTIWISAAFQGQAGRQIWLVGTVGGTSA
ncbi:hypothetical protein [Kibdelosporangium philippinense]|uniref:hypothetical protein n=1 Tax=Kibdelosporangium philippinense TaxID=211113 RepID=UPI00360D28F8